MMCILMTRVVMRPANNRLQLSLTDSVIDKMKVNLVIHNFLNAFALWAS